MIIRTATETDRTAIVQLLKASLGDSLIPKSEALWQWKHEQNPFGSSYVLLAEAAGELIGLRAFLQWQWQHSTGIYKAIRAVDTATHPNHQGKGLFKQLTLQLVERCKADGIDFVFNTPNDKSRPGYLKMGWIDQGPLPVSVKPVNPIQPIIRKLSKKEATDESLVAASNWAAIENLPPFQLPISNKLQTAISMAYIQWRYGTNPLFTYNYLTDGKTYLLVYRMKAQGPIRELRIADIFSLGHSSPDFKDLKSQLRTATKQQKADVISVSQPNLIIWKKGLGSLFIKTKGPLVTLRQVAIRNENFELIKPMGAWNYSLGDLELF